MRRSLAFVTVSLLAIGAAGCTDEDGTFYIRQNQVPSEGCTVGAGAGTFLAQGLIDTNTSQGYIFTPLIESLAVDNVDMSAGGNDIVFVEGAEISLSATQNGESVSLARSAFQTRFSASILPSGQSGVAFEIVPVDVISPLASSLASPADRVTILAEIELFGTLDGASVTADTFIYPVAVCNGCLINNLGSCDTVSGTIQEGGVCNPFQDAEIDCCDGTGGLVCPAVPATPL